MLEIFKAYAEGYAKFNADELALIESVARPKKLRKRQYLLQEGEVCRYHCFIAKGLLRVYSVNEKGDESILRFAKEDGWISDCESLYRGTPSKFNIDAIEDSEVLLFENGAKDMLMEKLPGFAKMVHIMKNESSITFQHRIHESIVHTAGQKYQSFVAHHPEFALRVPQAMIASYLGIKPETLSRLRHSR